MADDQRLSQAEIDALFQQASSDARDGASSGGVSDSSPAVISGDEMDILGEIGNISFGAAATSLSTLLQQRVEITTPTVSLYEADSIRAEFPKPFVLVSVEYTEGLTGTNALVVQLQDAKTIADLMLGGNGENVPDELNELHLSAVAEAMNQMMGGAATAMSQIFHRTINISPPDVQFVDLSENEWKLGLEGQIVNVSFRMRVGSLLDSTIMQWIPLSFAKAMVNLIRSPAPDEAPKREMNVHSDALSGPVERTTGTEPSSTSPAFPAGTGESEAAAAVAHSATGGTTDGPSASREPQRVFRPEFVELSAEPIGLKSATEIHNLSLLLDVPLHVTVELGRTNKTVGEILNWAQGTVVELDKLAGEPVDILVNNKRVAIGEVVVIDENFGVRVTEIISPSDRVKKLQ
ncbi:flagellar motor switch phosphatase FliY [Alicyclobacillus herbarius]|uniref:flagellar motor switch phosphatase FliY n=1 Tax=Alicyclobacillus herbarius TaxID=122960 RepID=UPI0004205859|nr:flagellar motor switch phosphatase FliY [Alicyclobacillus herbarius]